MSLDPRHTSVGRPYGVCDLCLSTARGPNQAGASGLCSWCYRERHEDLYVNRRSSVRDHGHEMVPAFAVPRLSLLGMALKPLGYHATNTGIVCEWSGPGVIAEVCWWLTLRCRGSTQETEQAVHTFLDRWVLEPTLEGRLEAVSSMGGIEATLAFVVPLLGFSHLLGDYGGWFEVAP